MTIYGQTGFDPTCGKYSFSATRGYFSVILTDGKKYVRFASESWGKNNDIEVINGAFYYEWGEISEWVPGSNHPTDSYAISGHFTSTSVASGQVKYAYAGKITNEQFFTAELIP